MRAEEEKGRGRQKHHLCSPAGLCSGQGSDMQVHSPSESVQTQQGSFRIFANTKVPLELYKHNRVPSESVHIQQFLQNLHNYDIVPSESVEIGYWFSAKYAIWDFFLQNTVCVHACMCVFEWERARASKCMHVCARSVCLEFVACQSARSPHCLGSKPSSRLSSIDRPFHKPRQTISVNRLCLSLCVYMYVRE